MAENPQAQEWFLEIDGKRVGPYSLEQIQGLLSDGEILEHHRVTTSQLNGRWIPVKEALSQFRQKSDGAQFSSAEPPSRPSQIEGRLPQETDQTGDIEPPRSTSDPTMDLFNSLQAARERQSAVQSTSSPSGESGSMTSEESSFHSTFLNRIPPQGWFILVLLSLAGFSIWGVSAFFDRQLEEPKETPSLYSEEDRSNESSPTSRKSGGHALRPRVPPPPPSQARPARPLLDTARDQRNLNIRSREDTRERDRERRNDLRRDDPRDARRLRENFRDRMDVIRDEDYEREEDFRNDPSFLPVGDETDPGQDPLDGGEAPPPDFYIEDGYESPSDRRDHDEDHRYDERRYDDYDRDSPESEVHRYPYTQTN